MLFADKLIYLRKKHSMTQEELADRLEVTRQSISKWESGQSMPDLPKIVQLSRLFGVSTDYLINDDIQSSGTGDIPDPLPDTRRLNGEQTRQYIIHADHVARLYATATALCMISPLILIMLTGNTGLVWFDEAISALIGIVTLFVLVALGAALFVRTGFADRRYDYLNGADIELAADAVDIAEQNRNACLKSMSANVAAGVVLCILSAVPVIVFGLTLNNYTGIGISIGLVLVTAGVILFVYAGTRWSAAQKILSQGEYSAVGKKKNAIVDKISEIYWPLILAVYLGYSFVSGDWGRSWIVWPVGAVLFAVVAAIAEVVTANSSPKSDKTEDDASADK